MKQLILCLALLSSYSHADLDSHEQQGLKDTQRMLRSKSERDEAIKDNKAAKDIDTKVEALTGSGKGKEEIYDLSAQVFEAVTKEANGDPQKMQQLLFEAQSHPQEFYNKYFSAEQKAKVHSLANDIERRGGANPPPR